MSKRGNRGFLDDFLGGNPVDPTKLSKNTIKADKFDQEVKDQLLDEMKGFSAADDRLSDVVTTGSSAFADMFYALVKAEPRLLPPGEVRPSHQVNRAVMDEAVNLKEYEELRTYSQGDEIGSALACISMEPELEVLFDKLKQEQKLAEQLEQQMLEQMGLDQGLHDLDAMMEKALSGQGEMQEQEKQDFQQRRDLIQQAMEKLQAQIQQTEQDLEQALGNLNPAIRAALKNALKEGVKSAESMEVMCQAWGLEPGHLHRLPAEERIAMAKRFQNEKFRRIAELFGPMQRMAFAEQMRKYIHSRDEVYDISLGNDLGRILPMEMLMLDDPILEYDFFRRYVEQNLMQYELRGTEKLAKGAIIFCEDGSGSMSGEPEIWAKAVGLCLLQIAKMQKRSFFGIHFGSPGQIQCFDFRDTSKIDVDNVIAFAELFFGGGTDFMTPLSQALDLMREEFEAEGKVKADIVFITDGMCGVDETWLEEFKKEQERIGFRVYGIIVGGDPETEPLSSICDKRVFTIKDLLTGNGIRDVFRNV